jgi:hypothetical protein
VLLAGNESRTGSCRESVGDTVLYPGDKLHVNAAGK